MTPSRSSTEDSPIWRFALIALALLCAGAALIAVWQIRTPVEQNKIKVTCERLAGAVERRDTSSAEALVSPNYKDGRGLNRAQLLRNLFIYLDAHGFSHVTPLSITVNDEGKDQAHATAKLWLAQAEPPPRGQRDAVELDLSFTRENGKWQVISAEDWELPSGDFEQQDGE